MNSRYRHSSSENSVLSIKRASISALILIVTCAIVTFVPNAGKTAVAASGTGTRSGNARSSRKVFSDNDGLPTIRNTGKKARAPLAGREVVEEAKNRMKALVADKKSWTPAQRKIDSNLIYASRMAAGRDAAPGVPALKTGVDVKGGMVEVELRIRVNGETAEMVRGYGGEILKSMPVGDSIIARVPVANLEKLAEDGRIRHIGRRFGGTTHSKPETAVAGPKAETGGRESAIRERLRAGIGKVEASIVLPTDAVPVAGIRTNPAKGDIRHRANAARAAFNLDGTGLKIGVISDSFNSFGNAAADVLSGDLPGMGNPNGYSNPVQFAGTGDGGGSDEGRAMLQVIHSIAPGAQLYFASGSGGIAEFSNNIAALGGLNTFRGMPVSGTIVPGGCDIIIDDLTYFEESGLHDGQAAGVVSPNNLGLATQAVNEVTAAGKMYFSAAGNFGNLSQGTSSAWEGDFTPSAVTPTGELEGVGQLLNWNPGGADTPFNTVTDIFTAFSTDGSPFAIQWSDPLGASSNDYDLFVLDADGFVIAASVNLQAGAEDPFEFIEPGIIEPGNRLVVALYDGAPRFISASANSQVLEFGTTGQVRGHAGAANGVAVASTGVDTSVGPTFPNPFGTGNRVEDSSSDGLRRVFFAADNSPMTPNNFLAGTGGGLVRQKPDVTAASGVATTVPGFLGFSGTSCAVSHAGAIAGLVRAAFIRNGVNPTPEQVLSTLKKTALDIEASGKDRDAGFGILQAFQAVQFTGLSGGAGIDLGDVTVTEAANSNGNGFVEGGENGLVTVRLNNLGPVSATGVSATLSTSTPGVTVLTANPRSYGTIAPNAGAANTSSFGFSLAPDFPCGGRADFTLRVRFGGGVVPEKLVFFSVATGRTGFSVTTNLDAVAPVANPLFTAVTGNDQIGRLRGNAVRTVCGMQKDNPGLSPRFPNSARRYDAYTFVNGNSANCVKLRFDAPLFSGIVDGPNGPTTNVLGVNVYTSFDPANPTAGYVADLGGQIASLGTPLSGSESLAFTAAPNTTYTVVVYEGDPGGVGDTPSDFNIYRLTVSGLNACQSVATPTLVNVNQNLRLAVTGQTLLPPTCPGYSNSLQLDALLTNAGTTTLQNLAFQVREIREASGLPPALPFRLVSADGATCASGGLVGATQSVSAATFLPPGQSVAVRFVIAVPEVRKAKFSVDAMGVDSGITAKRTPPAGFSRAFELVPSRDGGFAVNRVEPEPGAQASGRTPSSYQFTETR